MLARDRLFVAALALGLAAAVLGPSLGRWADHFLGLEFVDHHGTQWFYWYAGRTVSDGASPLHSDDMFYPWGKDVLGHTGANLLDAWLAIPFRALLGQVLGYNVFVVVCTVLSGLAFLPLGRQVTDDRFAVAVGAVLVGAAPYALAEAVEGRPTQAFLAFPLLFLAALLRTGRQPGLRAPLLAGLWLALCAYQYWYYAFFGGMAALAHGLWLTVRPPPGSGGGRAVLLRHALIAGACFLLVSPVLVPMLRNLDAAPGLLAVEDWSWRGAEPVVDESLRVGMYVWQPLRAAVGFFVQAEDSAPVFLERISWTPVVYLPLLLLAWARPDRLPRGAWAAMLLTVALIAMGPLLIVGSTALPNMAYIGLAKALQPLHRLWWPGRAYALMAPLLVLGVVVGLAWLRARFGAALSRVAAALVVGGHGVHLWSQDLLPFPTWDAAVPAGYRCLADGPPGAVIDLPFAWTQAHLYYQTVHERPMLGGMLENNQAFTPPELTTLVSENTMVRRLLGLTGGELEGGLVEVDPADRQAVLDLGYRYVVLQEDAFSRPPAERTMLDNAVRSRSRQVRRELQALLGPPVYDDARISIYDMVGRVRPCAGDAVPPDTVSPGMTATSTTTLVSWDPEDSPIHWAFAEDDADLEDPRGLLWGAAEEDAD